MSATVIVPVVGVAYRQDVVSRMRVGDPVEITPEPDNPHDPHALAVHAAAGLLGYLPAKVARRLGALRCSGEIAEVLTDGDTVGLRIRLCRDDAPGRAGAAGSGSPDADGAAAVPDVGAADVGAADVGAADVGGTEVRARSGRLLGHLVAERGPDVVVRTAAGHEVRYPRSLVRVEP